MSSKIRIKMGAIEVEYEGSEEFLKQELPDLLAAVAKLYETAGVATNNDGIDDSVKKKPKTETAVLKATTATIAAKLKVDSGPDLIRAACARLTLSQGLQTFTRKQIADEMKTASGYYKKTYMNNLSAYLHTLIDDGKLVEPSSGTYALSSGTREDLEKTIGQ